MEEVKKVAFVHGEFPVGGAERVTCDIANELFKRGGYEVYVFATRLYPDILPANLATDKHFHMVESPVSKAMVRVAIGVLFLIVYVPMASVRWCL